MDSRIIDLLEEMRSKPRGELFDDREYRKRIHALHSEVEEENDRIALLEAHRLLMDFVERRIIDNGEDPNKFRNFRLGDYKLLLIKEATIEDSADPDELARITRREVAEDRMKSDDKLFILAQAGSKVLGSNHNRSQGSRKRFLGRLFRRRTSNF